MSLLTAVLLMAPSAEAQTFGAKTMRWALPTREVERSLKLSKGWVEFGFQYDHKIGLGAWSSDGSPEYFEHARFTMQTETLKVRYGLFPRAELWWDIPVKQARLTNDLLGTDISGSSIGDPKFGYRFELFRTYTPLTSVVLEFSTKGAAGKESGGSYIGGPANFSSIVFTTGTSDWYFGAAAKRQVGPLAFTTHAGYTWRWAGVVQYLVELERSQFAGRIDPGDLIRADLEVMAQLGPVVLAATPVFEYRMKTRLGSGGVRDLQPLAESDGWSLDVRAVAMLQLGRGVDVSAHAILPVRGEDLQFFPIEDLQPTYGPTFGGTLEVRY